MVPKIAKRGASFKGAAAYYLHDKGAASSDRVAFSETRNLPVEEPELAWRWMAYTAKHAGVLKTDAGVAATGRKMAKPVYTLSLSWSPEEAPSREGMIAAAQSALKAVGLSKCQTLLVAHNDEPHPHIHAIVNLVDPDTGKVRDPGMDRRKLSRWAEAFEKEQGKIRCEQRVENNARRDRGEPARDTVSRSRQDLEQAKLIERQLLAARRESLWTRQVAEREALKQRARQDAEVIRAQLKRRFRPEWAAFFRKQRQDALDVKNARRSILAAMRVAIKERRRLTPDGRPGFGTILAFAISARALDDALAAARERELAELRGRMNTRREMAVRAVWEKYGRESRELKQAQAEARKAPTQLPPTKEAARRVATKRQIEKESPAAGRKTGERPPRRGPEIRLTLPDAAEAPAAPARSDEERRREELRAEFRQQAEEMARRRRERSQKEKDRDRDRER